MRSDFLWIFALIITRALASPLPLSEQSPAYPQQAPAPPPPPPQPPHSEAVHREEGEVISVRITSSVAVDRGPRKHDHPDTKNSYSQFIQPSDVTLSDANHTPLIATEATSATHLPHELEGANIEFLKQLHAKKEAKGLHSVERVHPFQVSSEKPTHNESDDSAIEESVKSILELPLNNNEQLYSDVPLARSVPPGSQNNYVQSIPDKPLFERNSPRRTTISFNIVHHSTPVVTPNYNDPVDTYKSDHSKRFTTSEHFYSEPPKVYSQPAKVYSEPAKVYSEPAKVYSKPAKVYSEPAKVYGEPAKIYSEPAKFYSQPASLHLDPPAPVVITSTLAPASSTSSTLSETNATATGRIDHQPERNFEVDEKVSVMTDGRSHGVQEEGHGGENCKQDKCKVGYVVEGRQYRKYRVEERTPDGFIVGEYGVVRNEDGALRGVRYTADGDASPRLIYDALMKFLQLR